VEKYLTKIISFFRGIFGIFIIFAKMKYNNLLTMKKIFTLICCSFLVGMFALSTQAQTIPNNGFENWTGTYVANNWKSNNVGTVYFLRQSTDKHGGTYAAQLLSLANGSAGNLSGILTLGTVNTTTQAVTGGIGISSQPTDLHGYYKYTAGNGAEQMTITVLMTKWTGTTRLTLFNGAFTSAAGVTVSAYTLFTIPITYSPNIIPDTFNIIVRSSKTTAVVGTSALVDDLAFTVSSGVEEPVFFEPSMYPNPATDKVFFDLNGEEYNISMTNMIGKNVYNAITSDKSFSVETGQLPVGIYIVNIQNKTHQYTMKLMVTK
jgi:hypothetical protein